MITKVKRRNSWDTVLAEYKKVRILTPKQIRDIKKNTLTQAKKALLLRKDLLEVRNSLDEEQEGWKTIEYQWLQKYLIKKYANLEYELFNNGGCNLVERLESLWEKTNNDKLEQVVRNINNKKYGNCSTSNYGDCSVCDEFGELDNGWGQNEGYHYECRPEPEINKQYAN